MADVFGFVLIAIILVLAAIGIIGVWSGNRMSRGDRK